ncbi:MAG: leucine-rich repeat protein [Ignavibacteriaceae bacterium]|nr:leucine-rich repeat protein [Ignavibacteriaceae bacterium]
MNSAELSLKLLGAYTNENLHKISVTLINLYRNEQLGTLRKIIEMINETAGFNLDTGNRYFTSLMMLYHPDRGDFHRQRIKYLTEKDDYDGLLGYSHILLLERIEEISQSLSNYEDIDYTPVYEWDVNLEGFSIIDSNSNNSGKLKRPRFKNKPVKLSFYDAIKIRMYGCMDITLPVYYLEDMEDIETAHSGITDLDGIQYCIYAVTADLSDNNISDISLLWDLVELEELNLSYNSIEEVDTLVNLKNLKAVDLSHTNVKDISYLMNLSKLEYLDITGLKVNEKDILELRETGVIVIT